ncbi:hypothetical protein [Actinomadura montaniterrae]|uniref:Uncharacterized protein n=1 Tax=Actinomadura montaniterrae TaxID=1803903 RepID=A0A6L3W2G0_9ACTN|nr:hypothetical protein [Actinomadura montaniterrae]KAB2384743.1 hypothetical protein F9B16_09860 [Actinomadura montaniterrae]
MQRTKSLDLFQGDDEQVTVTVSDEATGAAYDLTGALVHVYLKPSAETPDGDASVVVLAIGDGIEVLDAAAGQIRVTIPSSWLATAGTRWWHLTVVMAGATRTAARGPVHVLDT